VYTTGGAAAILAAQIVQQVKIDRDVTGLMKQCNFLLTDVLCTSFVAGMTSYQHLVNLDFVRLDNSCESSFGCIPPADIRYSYLQCFGMLVHEFFSVGHLCGSSGAKFSPIFNDPYLSVGLEAVHKESQDTSLTGLLRREMLACFQAYCTEQTTNAAYMTLALFDAKVPYDKACSLQTSAAPAVNIVTETTSLIALGKAGKKGHTLIDCDGPAPIPASKLARDEMIAVREKYDRDGRNTDRKARHLSSAATFFLVNAMNLPSPK
jgi:hypothetical protein